MNKFFEPLEDRRLLSLVVDLRLPGGGKTITVDHVGQKVDLQIWATATGSNASGADEALQIVDGSVLSTNVSGGAANGTLSADPAFPFTAPGATSGAQADLDGDGDLDVGSNDNSSANGFFFARADSLNSDGTVSGNHQSWMVGVASFTVTSLRSTSGSTNLVYRPRSYISGALWREDGNNLLKNGLSSDYLAGSAFVVKTSVGGTVNTGGISGQVYTDTDGSGSKNGSETGRSSVIVYIDKNKNGVLDSGESSTTTDGSGNYNFSSLASGSYRVRVVPPSNFKVTQPSVGYYDLSVGTSVLSGKVFGVKQNTTTTTGSISGRVYSDANKNGVFDTGDTLLSARKVYIDANNNGKLDTGEKTTTSNASGVYTFSSLAAGTYHIKRADVPSGYTVNSINVNLSAGQNLTNQDIGAIFGSGGGSGTGSISGTVFNDANKNGVLDSGESKLSSRVVYIDANNNGKKDTGEKSATTNSSGVYVLSGLGAGSYLIRRADLPAGYIYTTTVGNTPVSLGAGQNLTNINMGVALSSGGGGGGSSTASISGLVYSDSNKNGNFDSGDTKLSSRKMYIDANKNGKLDSGEKTVYSNSSGVFTFTGLAAGVYRIRRADMPSGYHLTEPSIGYYEITVVSGQVVSGKDFGAALN